MKCMRKFASIILALVMVMGLATTASATQEGNLTGGSITINDAVKGQTYNAYQILYLESYNATNKAYLYKANSAWETWLRTQTTYVTFDNEGYVTWVDGADAAAFAKLAQVEAAKMTADATSTADSTTVKFENLKLGYYLVDTTLGTLCSLDTTNPSVVMEEKNEAPTIVKKVQEDSDSKWHDGNDADIGQTVYFQTTVNAKPGAQKYIVHDVMSEGLTFNKVTSVKAGNKTLTEGTDYTVATENLGDGCTFHIVFAQPYLDTITANTAIVIEYNAILNEKAVIAGAGNDNETWLIYGDNNLTEKDFTKTYTWKTEIIKYTTSDGEEVKLAGAKFSLYADKNCTKLIKLSAVDGEDNTYIVDENGTVTEITTDANGNFHIKGLDEGTYYLKETVAPAGYNMLKEPVTVVIGRSTADDYYTMTAADNALTPVKVENNAGAELPSTGGMGTTLFYVLGSVLAVGAAILLVTKKRMSTQE